MTIANCTIDQPKTEANYDAIPKELRQLKQWLNWKLVPRDDGRIGKVPVTPDGYDADAHALQTDFASVVGTDYGIGIYLDGNLVGIDVDHIGTDISEEEVDEICAMIGGYQETSPSGNGRHIIVRVTDETLAQLSPIGSASKSRIELYPRDRYFTVTGNVLSFDSLDGHDDAILSIYERYRPAKPDCTPRESIGWRDWLPASMRDEIIEAASADVLSMPESVSGNGGSTQMMAVLRRLHDGWGLTDPSDLLDAVTLYNEQRCDPPWSTDEDASGADSLLRKIDDVIHSDRPVEGKPLSTLMAWHSMQTDLTRIATEDWAKLHEAQSDKVSITFGGRPLAELADAADDPVDWLVDGVLSADQPTIFGARKKSLKTTWLLDLAIALDVGGQWLDHWSIPKRRKVLFITGESNYRATARRARRALQARGLSFADTTLSIEAERFPKFNSPDGKDLLGMRRTIEDGGYDVVIVDPLFRGMSGGTNSANLFEMGDALGGFMAACAPASVIISHHVKKSASHSRDIPELDDLSQSGVSEFAGNYVLFGRMGDYAGDGKHDMALMYGGRDEQYGQYHIDFDEFAWTATVEDWSRYADRRTVQRELRQQQRHDGKARAVLEALDAADDGELSLNKIASETGSRKGSKVLTSAIESLQASGDIVPISMTRGSQTFEGFRRCYPDDSASVFPE